MDSARLPGLLYYSMMNKINQQPRSKNFLRTLVGSVLLGSGVVIVFLIWTFFQFQPIVQADKQTQRVVVAKGDSVSSVAAKLKQQQLIRNATVFKYYMQLKKLDRQLQAGSYELSPSMSLSEVARQLTLGTEDVWITLPEGWRREEIASYLASQDLEEFDAQEFLELTTGLEGTLYPDTYLVPREISASQLVSLLTDTFEKKITVALAPQFEQSVLDPQEVIVLASIVEREAKDLVDMRHVAGILLNRLEINMALQADATLQYIRGYDEAAQSWWSPPRVSDKTNPSLYNTYLYPGLPPAPIANPGYNAVLAVLTPIQSNNYFYIHTPSGEAVYAETIDQHNTNIDTYLR